MARKKYRAETELTAKSKMAPGLRQASREIGFFVRKQKGQLGQLGGVGTSAIFGGIAGAAAVAGTAVIAYGAQLLTTADNIDNLSKSSGLSTDAIQVWGHIVERAGGNADSVAKSVNRLSRQIENAERGSVDVKRSFDALGLSLETLSRSDADTRLDLVFNALRGVENETERAKIAFDLFGRQADSLIGTMGLTEAEFEKVRAKAEEMGIQMSTDEVERLDAYEEKWADTKDSLRNFATDVVIKAVDAIMSIGAAISAAKAQLDEFLGRLDVLAVTLEDVFGPSVNDAAVDTESLRGALEDLGITVEAVDEVTTVVVEGPLTALNEKVRQIAEITVAAADSMFYFADTTLSAADAQYQLSLAIARRQKQEHFDPSLEPERASAAFGRAAMREASIEGALRTINIRKLISDRPDISAVGGGGGGGGEADEDLEADRQQKLAYQYGDLDADDYLAYLTGRLEETGGRYTKDGAQIYAEMQRVRSQIGQADTATDAATDAAISESEQAEADFIAEFRKQWQRQHALGEVSNEAYLSFLQNELALSGGDPLSDAGFPLAQQIRQVQQQISDAATGEQDQIDRAAEQAEKDAATAARDALTADEQAKAQRRQREDLQFEFGDIDEDEYRRILSERIAAHGRFSAVGSQAQRGLNRLDDQNQRLIEAIVDLTGAVQDNTERQIVVRRDLDVDPAVVLRADTVRYATQRAAVNAGRPLSRQPVS